LLVLVLKNRVINPRSRLRSTKIFVKKNWILSSDYHLGKGIEISGLNGCLEAGFMT